jgi:hypothetical protein
VASWKSPGRAERVVIYLEGRGPQTYWRAEDENGEVSWREHAPRPGEKVSGEAITTDQLVKLVEASLHERRRAARGLKFRL